MTSFMPSNEENWEAYEFSEADKAIITAMSAYDEARKDALHVEGDVDVLWRIILAADKMREALGMMP